MFPYPSGAGLHVGHPEGYTATDIESTAETHEGTERNLLVNVTGLIEGRHLLRMWCTLRAVTERKREERALRESEALNKAIIQTALDGVIIVDSEERFLERTNGHRIALIDPLTQHT